MITQNTADSIYKVANIIVIVGSSIALIGSIATIFSGRIREHYGEQRITHNELLTSNAKADAAKAYENAEKAKAEAAIAKENTALSNLRVAEIEKQNTELRIKFASRRITEQQHKILVEELSKSRSSFNIECMGDPESGIFAGDILKTFTDSGWSIDKKEFPLGVIWEGLILYQTNDPAILIIANALDKAGIKYRIGDEVRQKATIMVGGKPRAF